MTGIENALVERRPSLLVVYGDVNSTMAATITAAKMMIPVAHVEAGLRSFDRSMPEELNRLVTDRLSTAHSGSTFAKATVDRSEITLNARSP